MNSSLNLFVDTSGWGDLFDARQRHHELAAMIYNDTIEANQKLITRNYVLVELVALLHSPLRFPRKAALEILEGIKNSPYIETVHITPELDAAAWQILKSREDKEWSLCDAASFAVMQQENLSNALTTDHHFEQAGFNRLLK